MKKVTFPHMENLNIPLKAFLREMGLKPVEPPEISRKTLDLGVKYGPEFACLPLKYNIGNFIQALEMGAEVILMGGGIGPCRFGYYGEVQKEILRDLGYDFEMVSLEPNIFQTFTGLRELFGGIKLKKFYNGGKIAWKKVKNIDRLRESVFRNRAREIEKGKIDSIYNKYLGEIDNTETVRGVKKTTDEYIKKIKQAVGENKRGIEIKVALVGEIYMLLEPFANLEIAKKLGKLGVTVERRMSLTNWLRHFIGRDKKENKIYKKAQKYMEIQIGGHACRNIGKTVMYAEENFDGVIHISPFTCMPEIVAQMLFPRISKEKDIPVLSLVFDEHTGEAGLITRLEAFVDLIYRKKLNRKDAVNE